ncbi:hypothetical protein Y032_0011g1352 [Ancylostoma ceylanicum]|uniref:Uncharacterized protein n=1 Tax=Ancylostoma ceylanicum TaxID=53326 RepID=A0A016VEK2_9BILA|nr:hypothetical protein Y032_0011g1352 [Ancylostoma ceylanicum]
MGERTEFLLKEMDAARQNRRNDTKFTSKHNEQNLNLTQDTSEKFLLTAVTKLSIIFKTMVFWHAPFLNG